MHALVSGGSKLTGFFRVHLRDPSITLRIRTFALAGARSLCGALCALSAGGLRIAQGLWPLSSSTPVALFRSASMKPQFFFVLRSGASGLLATVVRVAPRLRRSAPIRGSSSRRSGPPPVFIPSLRRALCASGLPVLLLARPP